MLIQIESLDKTSETLYDLITGTKSQKSHSILISGEKGIGKTHLIKQLCSKLLNTNQEHHLNLLWLDTENTKVNVSDIRGIHDFMYKTSYSELPKIIVVDCIEELNIQSLNALLKLLEEPTSNTYFILISHNSGGVIKTIRSRCVSIMLSSPSLESAKDIMIKQYPQLEDSVILQYLDISNSIPGYAINLINNNVLDLYNGILEAITKHYLIDFIEKQSISADNIEYFQASVNYFLTKAIKHSKNLEISYFSDLEKEVLSAVTQKYTSAQLISLFEEINQLLYNASLLNLSLPNTALIILNKLNCK